MGNGISRNGEGESWRMGESVVRFLSAIERQNDRATVFYKE